MKDLKHVEGWECPYCRKFYKTRRGADQHLPQCWENKEREPGLGEITKASSNSRSTEPWHPGGGGYIYTDDGWQEVPGYKAPTHETGQDDEWPMVPLYIFDERPTYAGFDDDAIAFDRLTKKERLTCWHLVASGGK